MPRIAAAATLWLLLLTLAGSAAAVDIPIGARSLTIMDATPRGGTVRLSFVINDKTAGITKGVGTDLGAIAASFRIDWLTAAGSFTVPMGADTFRGPTGWVKNDAHAAKFVNKNAKLGTPTGVSSLLVRNDRSVTLVARTAGDDPLNLMAASAPSVGVRTVLTITNGSESFRYCTLFPVAQLGLLNLPRGGRKLVAKNGVPRQCPVEPAPTPLQMAPVPSLPAVPAAPYLWFDGSDPSAVAAIVARTGDPETNGLYTIIHATVDGSLASLGSASDDTRALVAKGAGLLHVVGAVPAPGSGFASYRDVVVTALGGIGDRTALDSLAEFLTPPPDLLDVLHDSGRLQSMAEAYDLIRGSGVAPADDTAMRERIANWADEYLLDWNLVGFAGVAGHRDNWAIKAGSAVITAALAMPDHPHAAGWLARGVTWINESLARVVRNPGWYAESAHYLNYSLNNLVSTAWQLRNATGTDWFDDLEPFVDMAFALRQPDGREPPFEEGVADTFPWDVLAAAYPARATTMRWALDNSPGDFSAYENQQFHTVTRFFVRSLDNTATAPAEPPTRFVDGHTHAVILRSDWTADAFQLTGLTALDTSAAESFTSRHNMQNPLDLVLHAAGALLLPTASGGPQVTTSPDRSYYLLPSSKNIPLVDGSAPYILDPMAVTLDDTIDSRDSGSVTHRLLDAATTEVLTFAAGVDVIRTIAMVGDSYGVVVDRFKSAATHAYGVTWRGRGDGTLRSAATNQIAADYDWPNTASPTAHLAVDTTSAAPLSGSLVAGFYAPTYGVEETLDPLAVNTSGTDITLLSVLRPRADGVPASTLAPIAVAGGAGATVTDGSTVDVLVAGVEGTLRSAAGIATDARFALVRTSGGTLTGVAGIHARHLDIGGSAAVDASVPATFAATLAPGTVVVTIGSGVTRVSRITLTGLPSLNPLATHVATFDGASLPATDINDAGNSITVTLPGPGVLVVSNE